MDHKCTNKLQKKISLVEFYNWIIKLLLYYFVITTFLKRKKQQKSSQLGFFLKIAVTDVHLRLI